VYFLLLDGRVQYVGQSNQIYLRVANHWQNKKIPFDSWTWVDCDEADLDLVEAAYIRMLKPPHHVGLRGRRRSAGR
jgi:hypothetical protein